MPQVSVRLSCEGDLLLCPVCLKMTICHKGDAITICITQLPREKVETHLSKIDKEIYLLAVDHHFSTLI